MNVLELRDHLHSEITAVLEEEMSYVDRDLACQEDVIEVALDALPDPVDYAGEVGDYLDEVSSNLDLGGCTFRESVEGVIRELIYTEDINDYYKNNDVEGAVFDIYGSLAEVAAGCDTIQDIIDTAVACHRERVWMDEVSNLVDVLEVVIDQAEEMI